uniref:C1q domain-containing protein n=1 Tax=Acanthochromis polyacanthus TaxID=80966 RepID=A0A3Q1H0D3_9TELE
MEFRALLLLTLLGFVLVEQEFGQEADMDFTEWMTANKKFMKNLKVNLRNVQQCKMDVEALDIAFSASLANSGEIYRGPSTDKTLVFKRVFSNIGNGYNVNSGIFTPPVNGLYYFSFSTYGYNTHTVGAMLMKNSVHQISTYESPAADGSDSSSNAAVLQLAAGDNVHMELWDGGRVFDNLNGHTTFSGFLLFPL